MDFGRRADNPGFTLNHLIRAKVILRILDFPEAVMEVSSPRPWALLKEACLAWVADNAQSLGAAMAFYTISSIAPVLIIATAIAGLVFGREAAQGEVLRQIQAWVGQAGAAAIQTVLQSANRPTLGTIVGAVGIVTLLLSASGAFLELQQALNRIWKVKPRAEGILAGTMRKRFLSFGLVLGTGFLLLFSLALSAVVGILGKFMEDLLPGPAFLFEFAHAFVSFGVMTLLFAMIFKVLPDTYIPWSDVWLGATVTSLLFTIGRMLIGLYLGRSSVASVYGAAASLAIVLVWIYYSAQILLWGAEFTHVYANHYGSRVPSVSHPPVEGMGARAEARKA